MVDIAKELADLAPKLETGVLEVMTPEERQAISEALGRSVRNPSGSLDKRRAAFRALSRIDCPGSVLLVLRSHPSTEGP